MKRGFHSLDKVPGQSTSTRWDEHLPILSKPQAGKPEKIRIVGGAAPIATHYIKFYPRGSDTMKGFYVLCPDWDIESGSEKDGKCPVCADFHPGLQVPDKFSWLKMSRSMRYLIHAFNLTKIAAGSKSDYWGLINLNIIEFKQLGSISEGIGHSPDDLKKGVVLSWVAKRSSNPYAANGLEYSLVSTGKTLPVKYIEEKDLFVTKFQGSIIKGPVVDVLAYIEIPSASDIRQSLQSLGCYDVLRAATGGTFHSTPTQSSFDMDNDDDLDIDNDSLDVEEDDDEPVRKKKNNKNNKNRKDKSSKKKNKKAEPEDDEDFDLESPDLDVDEDLFDDDSSSENAASSSKVSGKKNSDLDDVDDDEDFSDFDFDSDDDVTFD